MINKPTQFSTTSPNAELYQIITKILNISEEEFFKNTHLFQKINTHTLNCLYYLSTMQNEQHFISASYALEFVCNFGQNPFSS